MTEIKSTEKTAGEVAPAATCSRYLEIPLDAGTAFIPLGMSADSYDLMVATLDLWKPRIVEGPMDRPDRPQATYKFKWVLARSMALARKEGRDAVTVDHLKAALADSGNARGEASGGSPPPSCSR